jgi:hypothetical protein
MGGVSRGGRWQGGAFGVETVTVDTRLVSARSRIYLMRAWMMSATW